MYDAENESTPNDAPKKSSATKAKKFQELTENCFCALRSVGPRLM